MAETNPPLPRRMTLAHQPFYGVLDLKSGDNLTLQEFIGEGDYGDLIVKRRLNLEHDLIEGSVRYVCQRCRGPMVLRSIAAGKEREDRFYLKHRYRSQECGGFKGLDHDAINALKYANTKESVAHRDYKALIVASLEADPAFSDTKTEATWFGLDGVKRRKPDVQTVRDGQRIALEVQLSTTFVEVVAQRQAFYRANVGHLIWFFRDLSIAGFRQAEDDIFYNNNRNAFLVTEKTVALSQHERRFAVECAWHEPFLDGWVIDHRQKREIVFFDQLRFDVNEDRFPRAFYFDYDTECRRLEGELDKRRQEELKAKRHETYEAQKYASPSSKSNPHIDFDDGPIPTFDHSSDDAARRLMEEFITGFPNHVDNNYLWNSVRIALRKRGFELPEHVKYDPVFPVLQAAYSAKLGRPVGCEQQYLIQLANTLFNSHKPALWVFSVMMSFYDRGALLLERGDRKGWLGKVREYHQAWIDGDPAYRNDPQYTDILVFLFPEAEAALRQSPVEYVAQRRKSSK